MASSEDTPLLDTETASRAMKDVNQAVSKLFTKENLADAGNAAREKFKDLRQQVSDGDFSIRLLALIGGAALVVSAGFGVVKLVLSFQISKCILELYTFLLGLVMLFLESRGRARQHFTNETQATFSENMFRTIYKYAFFLKFVWGRGGLYVVAGSLQLAQGSAFDYGLGCFVMLVGILYIVVGRETARKLTALRESLSEQTLRSKFQEADTDGNGTLSPENFQVLTEQLGMTLSRREREVAFLCMDRKDTGRITFEDLQAWWSEWEEGNEIV